MSAILNAILIILGLFFLFIFSWGLIEEYGKTDLEKTLKKITLKNLYNVYKNQQNQSLKFQCMLASYILWMANRYAESHRKTLQEFKNKEKYPYDALVFEAADFIYYSLIGLTADKELTKQLKESMFFVDAIFSQRSTYKSPKNFFISRQMLYEYEEDINGILPHEKFYELIFSSYQTQNPQKRTANIRPPGLQLQLATTGYTPIFYEAFIHDSTIQNMLALYAAHKNGTL
jgi:hypothetical protein